MYNKYKPIECSLGELQVMWETKKAEEKAKKKERREIRKQMRINSSKLYSTVSRYKQIVSKHWISLKQAREEQVGWENKWYDWYYPYSRWISIGKGMVIGSMGGGVALLILGIMGLF